jgi:hypothetical protein
MADSRFHIYDFYNRTIVFEPGQPFRILRSNVKSRDSEVSWDYIIFAKDYYICHGHYFDHVNEKEENVNVKETIFTFKNGFGEQRLTRKCSWSYPDCLFQIDIKECDTDLSSFYSIWKENKIDFDPERNKIIFHDSISWLIKREWKLY